MESKLEIAINNYIKYHNNILYPMILDLQSKVYDNSIKLHEAVGFNMIIAHMLDYLWLVEKERHSIGKTKFIKRLDTQYKVSDGNFRNDKFQLIEGVNNAVKHCTLDNRGKNQIINDIYGKLSFDCLHEENGNILFKSKCDDKKYFFNYGRVVLLNISEIFENKIEDADDIYEILDGEYDDGELPEYYDDHYDPIHAVINNCNKTLNRCIDCRMEELECNCSTYIYNKDKGEYIREGDIHFNLEEAISKIGSSYD